MTAMPASVRPGTIPDSAGCATQSRLVPTTTAATRFSGVLIAPGLPIASMSWSRSPAGNRNGKLTRDSSHHVAGSASSMIGTPNAIHCRKLT
jgi:hypothetical protein